MLFPRHSVRSVAQRLAEGLDDGSIVLRPTELPVIAEKTISRSSTPAEIRPESIGCDVGRQVALVIGINEYEHLPSLGGAVRDAKAVADALESEFGYDTHVLANPRRSTILTAIYETSKNVSEADSVVFYFAGHGLTNAAQESFLAPLDAEPRNSSTWISSATLLDSLRSLPASAALVLIDSCSSSVKLPITEDRLLPAVRSGVARLAITCHSVGISDDDFAGHGAFTKALLESLQAGEPETTARRVFQRMRKNLEATSPHVHFGVLPQAGHRGGDFKFVRHRPRSPRRKSRPPYL